MRLQTPNTVCLAFILAIGLLSCKKGTSKPAPDDSAVTKTLELPAGSDAVIGAGNEFAFKFFNTVLQEDPGSGNKLVSTYSIYTALSMLYNGAANATKDSIAKGLQLQGISIDDLNALNKALIEQMPAEDSKVTMDIANSIWYSKTVPDPLPSFLDAMRTSYDATVQTLGGGGTSAVDAINAWVAAKTKNKIPMLVDQVPSDEIMILLNAIYFNGKWATGFKAASTHPANFHPSYGVDVSVPFMSGNTGSKMFVDSAVSMVELPYGGAKSYDMYLLMPTDQHRSITDLAASLDETMLTNIISKMSGGSIDVTLPKWESSYSISMKQHLTRLGMGSIFASADLSNMYPSSVGPLAVTRALHKTYIKVDEDGTEAAAVTSIHAGVSTSIPLSVTFDHPFLYIIREKQAGAILFIGIVNDPSK